MNTVPAVDVARLPELLRAMPKAELHMHIEGSLEPELILRLRSATRYLWPMTAWRRCARPMHSPTCRAFWTSITRVPACCCMSRISTTWRVPIWIVPWPTMWCTRKYSSTRRPIPSGRCDGDRHQRSLSRLPRRSDRAGHFLLADPELSAPSERESALQTLEAALPLRDRFIGVGWTAASLGNPPEKFARVFERCKQLGLRLVAHAGEEGPPAYIWGALDVLNVERIDHGVQSEQDALLMQRLVKEQIPLTVCPLSNLKLCVIKDLADHNLPRLLAAGLKVMINSDDPAYFGGYVNENYTQLFAATGMGAPEAYRLARNSLEASFASEVQKQEWIAGLDEVFRQYAAA